MPDFSRTLLTLSDDERKQWEQRLNPDARLIICACLECHWLGIAAELKAQACPKCDGRVCDQGSPEFTERLKARVNA